MKIKEIVALVDSATEGRWEVHPEPQPNGETGYHVAAIFGPDKRHECVGTFHSETDAKATALAMNYLRGIKG